MDLKTSRDFTLWKEGVEILGGGESAERGLAALVRGHEHFLTEDQGSGSLMAAAEQLDALEAAATQMALAIKGLQMHAWKCLTMASNPERNEQWKAAGGWRQMDSLNQVAVETGIPVEALGRRASLSENFPPDELAALAAFCRAEARLQRELHDRTNGMTSAARLHGTPTQNLAMSCAMRIHGRGGDMRKANALARIVEELVTGEKPAARFAERECRVARGYYTQTP